MTAARVTTEWVEVGVQGATSKARVTTEWTEVGVVGATSQARITTEWIEVGVLVNKYDAAQGYNIILGG